MNTPLPSQIAKDPGAQWQQAIIQGTNAYYSELGHGGVIRPDWQDFFSHLPKTGETELLNHRVTALNRQIRDNGITYNVYADQQQGATRPWSLNILPFILNDEEWQHLSQGIAQRAQLLNQLMVDAYGPQTMLNKGLLPPDLLHGHPGYLPPLHGTMPLRNVWLHLVAFDLGRGPDGRWWVISNRIQAPSGLGYALENRLSIARSFTRAFRDMQIRHLGHFYKTWIESLKQLSPKGEHARTALLTPGPHNETYFEHSWLARHLGIPLVEASDLVCRQNTLFLKTVQGLEQIDCLIRRTDDQWLDPLELREDSRLGIPGLIQALRTGGVVLANMPGGGWLESPALHGFLPALTQHFLQQELILPSVPSWWCGESPAWAQASDRFERLVIKSTSPDRQGRVLEPIMGSELTPAQKRNWLARISHKPSRYTLQELIPLSRAPIWTEEGLEERTMMLRLFAVTDAQGQYTVMPGGLTRIAGGPHGIVSMQRGGSSLDTWIRSNTPVEKASTLHSTLQAQDLQNLRRPVSSRAAEHLFWLGRYTERAFMSLRLLQHARFLLNEEDSIDFTVLAFLHDLCANQDLCAEGDPEVPWTAERLEYELITSLWPTPTEKNPFPKLKGLPAQLNSLAIVGGQLRERLSSGHWRLLNDAAKLLQSDGTLPLSRRSIDPGILERLQLYLTAMHGEQSDHMTRDTGWRFLQLGRQLERLINACQSLLSLTAIPGRANEQGLGLSIALADSTITYRSRYQHRFEWLPALDLLIFDKDSPYSVQRILYKINIIIDQLPGDQQAARTLFHSAWAGHMPNTITLKSLQPPFPAHTGKALRTWLQTLMDTASHLSDLTGAQYFRLSELPDQIIQGR